MYSVEETAGQEKTDKKTRQTEDVTNSTRGGILAIKRSSVVLSLQWPSAGHIGGVTDLPSEVQTSSVSGGGGRRQGLVNCLISQLETDLIPRSDNLCNRAASAIKT